MSPDNGSDHITGLVRRYSAQVAEAQPDDTLGQAVTAYELALQTRDNQAAEWRHWLKFDTQERDAESLELQLAAKEAAELWRKLKLTVGDTEPRDGSPPTVETLVKTVSEAQQSWLQKKEKGFGKAQDRFLSFAGTMDAHKYLFSVIPDGDKYISLLTGVVSSIVKASVNHENIADGFSQALSDMSKDLHLVQRMTARCNTQQMRLHIIALYREVFALLCHAIKWYQSWRHRIRTAFDNTFYDKNVKQRVAQIQRLVQRVRDEMNLLTDDTVQTISEEQRIGFSETNQHIDSIVDVIDSKLDTKLDEKFEAFAKLLLGQDMCLTLSANAEQVLMNLGFQQKPMLELDPPVRSMPARRGLGKKADLESQLHHLRPFVENDFERLAAKGPSESPPVIPNEVAIDIQRWITSRESKLLWVEGPAYWAYEDELAYIALRVLVVAEQVRMPCVHFFARVKYSFELGELSLKEAGLISMLYSLLTQIVDILPATFDPERAPNEEEFRQLNGTIDSVPTAIQVLQRLLALVEPGLVIVLHAFELIDGRDTDDLLVRLVDMFGAQPTGRRLKVLIISSGRCRSLATATTLDQRSDASRMLLARGSSPLPGAVMARDIRYD